MAFLLSTDGRDASHIACGEAFENYARYLEANRDRFPPGAFDLATSDWYFNPGDHRCPHDAWLESVTILESASGERQEIRIVSIRVRLLGAYHDGHIELFYPRVFSYSLTMGDVTAGHRDWRYDELRLSETGALIHEIEWCGPFDTGRWLIEASDVVFEWIPNA